MVVNAHPLIPLQQYAYGLVQLLTLAGAKNLLLVIQVRYDTGVKL